MALLQNNCHNQFDPDRKRRIKSRSTDDFIHLQHKKRTEDVGVKAR